MKYKTLLGILMINCFFLIIGCSNNKEHRTSKSKTIHFDVSNWETDKIVPKKIIKKINFIPLETNDQCLLSGISKIIAHDNKWFIMDSGFARMIYVFNKKGKYLYSIGNYGRGPGEFIRLADFTINKAEEKLLILDNWKVITYDCNNGSLIDDTKLPFFANNISIIGGDTIVLFSKNKNSRIREGYSITYFNLKNKSDQKFLPKNEYDINLSYYNSVFESRNIYYAPFLNDIVYRIESNGISPAIIFDYGKNKIPEDKLRNARIQGGTALSDLRRGGEWTYGITNILENDFFITLSLKLKQRQTLVIYSKETKKYYYGARLEGILNAWGPANKINISRDKNVFLGSIDAYHFKKLKNKVVEENDKQLNKSYNDIVKKVKYDSNPIIVSIEYNQF